MEDIQNQDPQDETQEDESEDSNQGEQMQQLSDKDELRLLKQRATMMGMAFSPNIGLQTLKDRIAEKLAESAGGQAQPAQTENPAPVAAAPVPEIQIPADQAENPIIAQLMAQMAALQAQVAAQAPARLENPFAGEPAMRGTKRLKGGGTLIPKEVREQIYAEQMKLVRIRVTCMDPKKRDLPGEIITVGNEAIGTVRKYIPFGEQGENGWHVPQCIYQFLKDKKFLHIRTRQDPKTRTPIVETGMVREYAIEVLDQLTTEELQQLARQQSAADSIDKSTGLS